MNKEKEFEEKILNKLLVDLKDIDKYKSFKNGSFIYDLGYYQGNLLINEIERLNNIINELENDLKKRKHTYENMNASINGVAVGCFTYVLKKLQELKENNKDV